MTNHWFTIKQIKPNLWALAEFNHFEKVISYLIVGQRQALLFDTGMGINSIKQVVENITKLPVIVINSHHHYDHVGGNHEFKRVKILKDNDVINIFPFKFKAIHAPGHSPDSFCLFEEKLRYLFAGDVLYPGPIYLHLKESVVTDYIRSIKKLLNLGKINHIFPGHNDFELNPKIIKIIDIKIKKIDLNKNIINIDQKTSLLLKE